MTDIRLTKDADYLLCVLYDAYRQQRKGGALAEDAKFFGDSGHIQEMYIPEWPTNDIDEAARELSRKKMIVALFAEDALNQCVLSDDGISRMEHSFGDKIDNLTQRIASLRTALFG